MWRTLQHREAGDYVGATGESHSVREFAEEAFRVAGVADWTQHVEINPKFNRPSEVYNLRDDSAKTQRELGWAPTTKFKELVRIMVEVDPRRLGCLRLHVST